MELVISNVQPLKLHGIIILMGVFQYAICHCKLLNINDPFPVTKLELSLLVCSITLHSVASFETLFPQCTGIKHGRMSQMSAIEMRMYALFPCHFS